MELSKYPYVKCLNPQVIRNKYTHEQLLIPCGKCEACLNRKSSISTLKCRLESQFHRYAMFVTLTYSDDYVPRMSLRHIPVIMDNHGKGYVHHLEYPYCYVENEPRLDGKECQVVINCPGNDSYTSLSQKVLHESIPYLCKRDLRNFIKRLRKYYQSKSIKENITYEKIRYFACGEYGPVHYRPHYHLVIWFDDEKIRQTIAKAVSTCWKFGRVSTEVPRDDVSKYVAKYLNGNSYLPKIFKSSQIRPFSLHSCHLGEKIFQDAKEEVYESPVEDIVRKSCFINGVNTEVHMWRSLTSWYFPKCKAFDVCTPQLRMYTYTLKATANEILGEKNCSQQTRDILGYLSYMSRFKVLPHGIGQLHSHPYYDDFYRQFVFLCDIDLEKLEVAEYYERCFRSVYMVLRLSNHFINFCCDGNLCKAKFMYDKIQYFYLNVELMRLNDRYNDIEINFDEWFEDEEEYKLLYQLCPDSIKQTKIYKIFSANTKQKFHDSMKHKELNDLNKIFDNQ